MPPRHHPFRVLGKLLSQNYLRLVGKILQDGESALQKSRRQNRVPEQVKAGPGSLSDPRWVMRAQGRARTMIGAQHGVVVVAPGGSMASGTAALSQVVTRSLRRTFRGECGQVPLVRDFVSRYLNGRHCPARAVQDTLVCATELAANAVLHSRSGLPGGHFSVQVACAGQSVHVTVEDSGGPWAERGNGGIDAECGRGLQVVAGLSSDMGIVGDAAGRTAWFCCQWDVGGDSGNTAVVGKAPPHPALNTSKPNVARIYDYLLGGKDNFAADRDEARRLLQVYPLLPARALENRHFLGRAVRWIADQGIRQFVDVGSGLPTAQNTHEVAQAVHPACRVAYVDYDPVVVTHVKALTVADGVTAIESDLRDPAAIISHPETERVIRLDKPLCLVLGMILHFFEAQAVSEIMRTIIRSIAPGSYVIISVGSGDEQTATGLARAYTATTLYNHAAGEVAGFFDGLEIAEPGLVDARNWESLDVAQPPAEAGWHILTGVGQKT